MSCCGLLVATPLRFAYHRLHQKIKPEDGAEATPSPSSAMSRPRVQSACAQQGHLLQPKSACTPPVAFVPRVLQLSVSTLAPGKRYSKEFDRSVLMPACGALQVRCQQVPCTHALTRRQKRPSQAEQSVKSLKCQSTLISKTHSGQPYLTLASRFSPYSLHFVPEYRRVVQT